MYTAVVEIQFLRCIQISQIRPRQVYTKRVQINLLPYRSVQDSSNCTKCSRQARRCTKVLLALTAEEYCTDMATWRTIRSTFQAERNLYTPVLV